jgi:hypothetical protein
MFSALALTTVFIRVACAALTPVAVLKAILYGPSAAPIPQGSGWRHQLWRKEISAFWNELEGAP